MTWPISPRCKWGWLIVGQLVLWTLVGSVTGDWSYLLFSLSGMCIGQAIWLWVTRDIPLDEARRVER